MEQTFLIAGLACLIAALVGGGLKAFGIEIPILNSLARQVILGILGIALIVMATMGTPIQNQQGQIKPDAESGNKKAPEDDNSAKQATEDQPYKGEIKVAFTCNPYLISAGGQTTLAVLALTDQNDPIADARVKIESGGGWFGISGTHIEVGTTNANGSFNTTWRSPNPAATGYGLNATVSKANALDGKAELMVKIQQ